MGKRLIAAMVAGAMMVGSTAAVAAESSAPIAGSSPWATLSMISSASTAASFCGSSAAIAGAAAVAPGGCVLPQVDDAVPVAQAAPPRPVPVPPVEPMGGLYFDPLLLGIGALALAALVYFVLIKKGGDSPNSPA